MVWETWVQSQVASYQSLQKWHLIPPCLTLSNIRYVSRVKWSNPGKGVALSPTPWCSSYWKGSLLVALDYSRQLYCLPLRLIAFNMPTGQCDTEAMDSGRFRYMTASTFLPAQTLEGSTIQESNCSNGLWVHIKFLEFALFSFLYFSAKEKSKIMWNTFILSTEWLKMNSRF